MKKLNKTFKAIAEAQNKMNESTKQLTPPIDYSKIDNVVTEGKYPADIYIVSADYDGVEMTDEQIDELSPDFAGEWFISNN